MTPPVLQQQLQRRATVVVHWARGCACLQPPSLAPHHSWPPGRLAAVQLQVTQVLLVPPRRNASGRVVMCGTPAQFLLLQVVALVVWAVVVVRGQPLQLTHQLGALA